MKLKTFFISYALFLAILLGALATISFYLTRHQIQSLQAQSVAEYQRISGVIEREVNAVYERGVEPFVIDALLESHINFHLNRNVLLTIEPNENVAVATHVSFENLDGHLIQVEGNLNTLAGGFDFGITFDVTESTDELREIQRVFLHLFVIFSLISALILYVVLNKIFQPLEQVATSAKKIADGNFDERIILKGKNEIAVVADHFNQMASEIESKIHLLQEESQRKQQFMDNLAHEIRTPLTSIYAYAELMQRVALNEKEKYESIGYIMSESTHMKKITNSMLELAALRNHTIEKEEISIEKLFSQIANTLEMPFKEYQVGFTANPINGVLLGQDDLIKSLILNLCMNSAKACESGVGAVVLKAQAKTDQIIISVADNGCGMANEELEKITEPFYQVDKVRNRASGGIGLGLTLVKEITNLHQAELIIESTLGTGTTVKLIFTT